jgi:ACS family D-galactonate transporter-like MFS transporter
VPDSAAADRRHFAPRLWIVLALLGVSVFINYIDRGNLSIAAPLLKDELGLSPSQLGILLSSFFWTYAFCQPLSGWLVDRFNVSLVMAAGFFLWSAATAATGLIHAFAALLIVRLILGIGESVAYPSYSKLLARHFPEDRRGFANSVISAGLTCGPAFGMFVGGKIMGRVGWRPFFIVLGLASMIWLLPWLRWMPSDSGRNEEAGDGAPSLGQFLRQRSAWGSCGGLFAANYLSYSLITWLPYYLVRGRHFSMDQMANIAGSAYLGAALFGTLCGWLSDRWIDAGATPTLVRKTFTGTGVFLSGTFLLLCAVSNARISVMMLLMATLSFGMCSSNIWAITQTLAGPQAAGRWTGFQNFVGNLSGIAAPAVTGFVLDRTGSFFWAFAIMALVGLFGAVCWIFVIDRVEQVSWKASPTPMVMRSGS